MIYTAVIVHPFDIWLAVLVSMVFLGFVAGIIYAVIDGESAKDRADLIVGVPAIALVAWCAFLAVAFLVTNIIDLWIGALA